MLIGAGAIAGGAVAASLLPVEALAAAGIAIVAGAAWLWSGSGVRSWNPAAGDWRSGMIGGLVGWMHGCSTSCRPFLSEKNNSRCRGSEQISDGVEGVRGLW